MRLPRMTTRRWMILVAVVAFSIAGVQMRRQAKRYREQAAFHALREGIFRRQADLERRARLSSLPVDLCGQQARYIALIPTFVEYHAELRRKYEYAARYPWLPIEPDPPKPE